MMRQSPTRKRAPACPLSRFTSPCPDRANANTLVSSRRRTSAERLSHCRVAAAVKAIFTDAISHIAILLSTTKLQYAIAGAGYCDDPALHPRSRACAPARGVRSGGVGLGVGQCRVGQDLCARATRDPAAA